VGEREAGREGELYDNRSWELRRAGTNVLRRGDFLLMCCQPRGQGGNVAVAKGGLSLADVAELRQRIKEMIVERLFLDVAAEDIGDDESLPEKYNVDSVNLFEIVVGLEEVFDITLGDEELSVEAFSTVAKIAEVVQRKLEGK
jgi:acyl carrier protein